MKRIDVAIAIVCRQQEVLICRRKSDGHLGGFWEFPGGKVEPGESPIQCLARELLEEVDLTAEVITPLAIIEHDYPDRQVRLHSFLCAYQDGQAKPLGCDQAMWVPVTHLRDYQFPPANEALIDQIIQTIDARRLLSRQ